MGYKSQAARDAEQMIGRTRFWTRGYADDVERTALEYAERWPERAEEFLGRPLGEALAGNDGE
jgi:hypothetical protein